MFKTIEPELCNLKLEKEDIKMCIGRCDGPSGIPDTYVCFRQVAFFNVSFFITHSFKISSEYRIRTVYSHFGPVFLGRNGIYLFGGHGSMKTLNK